MKNRVMLIAAVLVYMGANAQSLNWVQQVGGPGNEQGFAVASDGSSNIYSVGNYQGSIGLGSFQLASSDGTNNIYIARWDQSGNVIWAKQSFSSSYIYGLSIAVDPGNDAVYITGYFGESISFDEVTLNSSGYHDMFLLKLDTDGSVIWGRRAGGDGALLGDVGRSISVGPQGQIYVCGEFEGTANFGGHEIQSRGGQDVFIAKYNPEGEAQWALSGGGEQNERGMAIVAGAAGEVYLSGSFRGSIALGGQNLDASGYSDSFLAKYDEEGNLVWANTLSGSGELFVRSMCMDENQGLIVAGSFSADISTGNFNIESRGGEDFFLSKFSSNGTVEWVRSGGGVASDRIYGVGCNEQGEILTGGIFQSAGHFGPLVLTSRGMSDAFIAQYSPDGELRWAQSMGGPADDVIWSIAADGDNLISTGAFYRTASFGPGGAITLEASPENKTDAFLASTAVQYVMPTSSSGPQSPEFSFEVFPNPTSGLITLHFAQGGGEVDSVRIYTLSGQLALSVVKPTSNGKLHIQLDEQLAGQALLVEACSGGGSVFRKIIFEKY